MKLLAVLALGLALAAPAAQARMLCAIVADAASGAILLEDGDCRTRVTPASTFKVPLALMGFDSGFLTGVDAPRLDFREGLADWGGAEWRQPTDPARWMKYSVVWYSQEITRALGRERLEAYAAAFGLGNADFSGDPGQDNGLERAWISSSLAVAPLEQVAFLRRLVTGDLPVSGAAIEMTARIVEGVALDGGWQVRGKTGSAYPRLADGTLDRARGWGWYVGWAVRDDELLVFARLDQDEQRHQVSGGLRTRDAFLAAWPALAEGLGGKSALEP